MANSSLPNIQSIPDLKGKRVLVRASLNVPVSEGVVTNQFRLMRALPTLNYLHQAGAKVVVIGHISGSKETEKTDSLKPVYDILKEYLPISFCPEVATPLAKEQVEKLADGEMVLLENLRQDPREKKNDADFARSLADLADVYVNDAFAASHRSHASLVGVPTFIPAYAGMNFVHEYEELQKSLAPESPSLFLLGGAKFDTKMPLVEKFLNIYDHVFIGGALANDLYKAKGLEIGKSLVSENVTPESLASILANEKLLLPIDLTVVGKNGVRTSTPEDVQPDETILDAGPDTVTMLTEHIDQAKMVLWNGPLGNYEKGFETQTVSIALAIAAAPGYSVVGGGDTVASIEAQNCQEKYNFLSTAGGAMLSFLELGSLPALEAIVSE